MQTGYASAVRAVVCGGTAAKGIHMANLVLKNIKKIYPNAPGNKKAKKKKKDHVSDEPKANLQITAEGVVAVQQFSLDIADKEFIVLVGPSGCGKSTTLRMIAGLEEISDGELYIGDKLVNDVAPQGPRHRHGLPELRSLSPYDCVRQHGLLHEAQANAQG